MVWWGLWTGGRDKHIIICICKRF